MKALRAELAELAPGRQLIRFLKERASAEDYRRHLGLVSIIRKDFEQLSRLLIKAAEDEDPSLPKISRIVLYIDDLDRCRAERVIEVLEAVHLLLAFPLFAVVVAVDPRWLRQSLLDHYPRLLSGPEHRNHNGGLQVIGRPATPQDYLEKIFQVPFNLQPMEKGAFSALVERLFPVPSSMPESSEASVTMSDCMSEKSVQNHTHAPLDMSAIVHTNSGPSQSGEAQPSFSAPNLETGTISTSRDESHGNAPSEERAKLAAPEPRRLTLTCKEVIDIQVFQPLFQTPRTLKRLANTYSLIRVGVNEEAWNKYLGPDENPGEYRIPMLLLAVTSAFPGLARIWLLWLVEENPDSWHISGDDALALAQKGDHLEEKNEWEAFAHLLNSLDLNGWPLPSSESLREWVPRVARYSFS